MTLSKDKRSPRALRALQSAFPSTSFLIFKGITPHPHPAPNQQPEAKCCFSKSERNQSKNASAPAWVGGARGCHHRGAGGRAEQSSSLWMLLVAAGLSRTGCTAVFGWQLLGRACDRKWEPATCECILIQGNACLGSWLQ